MAKFNTVPTPATPDAITHEGGTAYAQNPELEFVSILLTSFVTDQFYRSADETMERVTQLLEQIDPKFAAKAAIYARNEFGMRSISHVVAAEVARRVSGQEWTKEFIYEVVRRPDDITEILAYTVGKFGKPLTNGLKKGLAQSFDKFNGYKLAKYRSEGKTISLVDAVNLVHPTPVEKNSEALKALVDGTLKSTGTWESKLSATGGDSDAKEEAWRELIQNKEIGHFALLRNLRNISEQAPELVPDAAELLTDENAIKGSLVLPFRYLTALKEITEPKFVKALSKAIDISLVNVPTYDGKTLIVVDHSGSMHSPAANSKLKCYEIGDAFAAALAKTNDADVMVFGTDAGYVKGINTDDSTLGLAEKIGGVNYGHGTSFTSIFATANKAYDRIIIFSDMQAFDKGSYYHSGAENILHEYKQRTDSNPFVYSFDLQGYGNSQFSGGKIFPIAGFSEKVFDIMKIVEQDKNALVNTIKAVKL